MPFHLLVFLGNIYDTENMFSDVILAVPKHQIGFPTLQVITVGLRIINYFIIRTLGVRRTGM